MKKILIVIFSLITISTFAQKFEYQVSFEGIGDNREFDWDYSTPETILGARGAFEIGLSEENHKLRIGLNHLFEFGSDFDELKPHLTLYYQYKDLQNSFLFGAFSRKKLKELPLAMIERRYSYFNPNIEGILVQKDWNFGFQNLYVDWLTRQTTKDREEFLAATTGEYNRDIFFLENSIMMIHSMTPRNDNPDQHIKDYFGASVNVGYHFLDNANWKGYFKTGLLLSGYRERSVTDGFDIANSSFSEGYLKYKKYAIKSSLNLGEGHKFKLGDSFYQNDSYSRTDLMWHLFEKNNLTGVFTYSFHLVDGSDLSQQQMLTIFYRLGN